MINLHQEEVGDKTIVIHLIVHVPYKVVYDHPKIIRAQKWFCCIVFMAKKYVWSNLVQSFCAIQTILKIMHHILKSDALSIKSKNDTIAINHFTQYQKA